MDKLDGSLETTITEFSKQVREEETTLANLLDIVSHSRFTDLTPGDKKQLDRLHEIQAKIGDAGYELLLVQELVRQLLVLISEKPVP